MRLSFKYRIYPTKEQQEAITRTLRACCSLYNAAIQERREAYQHKQKYGGKNITLYDQTYQIKPMRDAGLIDIDNFSVAWNVLDRVDKAYKLFFEGIKQGRDVGLPDYRPSRRYDSFTYSTAGYKVLSRPDRVRLHGVGTLRMELHRSIEGKIKTVTVKREADQFFVIFSCEVETKPLPASDNEIALDVGLLNYTMDQYGNNTEFRRFYQEGQRKLRIAQRKVARRKKGSTGRKKAVMELQKLHLHIARQRADYQHKVARSIVNKNGCIVVEDLNIKSMVKQDEKSKYPHLAKDIHDAAWASLISKIEYKAALGERRFEKVDPAHTSQLCSSCGTIVLKDLSVRVHDCPKCGLKIDVDQLAAINIAKRKGGGK